MANTFILIGQSELSTTTTDVTFSSIPGTYKDVVLYASLRTVNAATASGLYIQVNGNSSGIYQNVTLAQNETSYTSTTNSGNTAAVIDYGTVAASGTANSFSGLVAYFNDYAGSRNKTINMQFATNGGSGANYQSRIAQYIGTTSAITSIRLFGDGSFAAGSSFYLYGIKNS